MLTLYLSPGSSAMATHIALHEIGVPFESRPLSFARREQHSPDYLAINPEGKVPTLLIDGRKLTEVAATLYYLAKRYPEAGLWPAGGIEAEAQAISWMSFIAATIHPARRIGLERWKEVFKIADPRLGAQRVDGRRPLFDRRHPPVPAVLAVQDLDLAGARRIPEPRRPFRANDGAPGGQEDDRDRECHRLQPAITIGATGVAAFVQSAADRAEHHAGTCARHWRCSSRAGWRMPEALYRTVIERDPDHVRALFNLGLVRVRQGGLDDAIGLFSEALRRRPDFAEAENALGIALRLSNRHEEALAHYARALAIKPDYAEAENNLGLALHALGRGTEALPHYQRAISIKPDYAEAENNFGAALRALHRYDEAVAHYRRAVADRPGSAAAHNNLGVALQLVGRHDEALAQAEQALALMPDFPEAHHGRGTVLRTLGRLDEARRELEQAIALAPRKAEFYRSLAEAKHFTEGDPHCAMIEALARDMAFAAGGGAQSISISRWARSAAISESTSARFPTSSRAMR